MGEEHWFVLGSDEGGISIQEYSSVEKFLAELAEDMEEMKEDFQPVFLDRLPNMYNGYFEDVTENARVLIKGTIVVPKAVEVVTQYMVE